MRTAQTGELDNLEASRSVPNTPEGFAMRSKLALFLCLASGCGATAADPRPDGDRGRGSPTGGRPQAGLPSTGDTVPADAPPGEPVVVTLHTRVALAGGLGEVPGRPTHVAFQDGRRQPWQTLDVATDTLTFQVTHAQYGVAVLCAADGARTWRDWTFVHRTTAEQTELTVGCAAPADLASSPTLTFEASENTTPFSWQALAADFETEAIEQAGVTNWEAVPVVGGPYDVAFVLRNRLADDPYTVLDRVRLVRDVDPARTPKVTLDLASTSWMRPIPARVVLPAEHDSLTDLHWESQDVRLRLRRGTQVPLTLYRTGAARGRTEVLPANGLLPGDVYSLTSSEDFDHALRLSERLTSSLDGASPAPLPPATRAGGIEGQEDGTLVRWARTEGAAIYMLDVKLFDDETRFSRVHLDVSAGFCADLPAPAWGLSKPADLAWLDVPLPLGTANRNVVYRALGSNRGLAGLEAVSRAPASDLDGLDLWLTRAW